MRRQSAGLTDSDDVSSGEAKYKPTRRGREGNGVDDWAAATWSCDQSTCWNPSELPSLCSGLFGCVRTFHTIRAKSRREPFFSSCCELALFSFFQRVRPSSGRFGSSLLAHKLALCRSTTEPASAVVGRCIDVTWAIHQKLRTEQDPVISAVGVTARYWCGVLAEKDDRMSKNGKARSRLHEEIGNPTFPRQILTTVF